MHQEHIHNTSSSYEKDIHRLISVYNIDIVAKVRNLLNDVRRRVHVNGARRNVDEFERISLPATAHDEKLAVVVGRKGRILVGVAR